MNVLVPYLRKFHRKKIFSWFKLTTKIKHAKKIIDRNFLFLQELFPIQANNYNSAIVLISHVTKGHTHVKQLLSRELQSATWS